jgi:Icc-related predicted phosphoesterase
MKIHVLSDLHLEFGQFTLKGGEVLLLAGDITVAALMPPNRTDKDARKFANRWKQFFHTECAKYDRVYYIMGNHEHYRGLFDNTADILREALEGTNVTLLDKEFVDLTDNWKLFGGTLWTDYNNGDWFAVQAAKDKMNDHTIIKKLHEGNEPVIGHEKTPYVGNFTPYDAMEEHKKTIEALICGLYEWKDIDKNFLVMTHHAPCGLSVHSRFTGDILNYAYFTELGEWMLDHPNIKYWIHGHTHYSFDYNVGETRVICNPRGYHGYEVNPAFKVDFELEI